MRSITVAHQPIFRNLNFQITENRKWIRAPTTAIALNSVVSLAISGQYQREKRRKKEKRKKKKELIDCTEVPPGGPGKNIAEVARENANMPFDNSKVTEPALRVLLTALLRINPAERPTTRRALELLNFVKYKWHDDPPTIASRKKHMFEDEDDDEEENNNENKAGESEPEDYDDYDEDEEQGEGETGNSESNPESGDERKEVAEERKEVAEERKEVVEEKKETAEEKKETAEQI